MSCLASLGAHIDGFITSARDADLNITIDGCPVACARKIFDHLDIKPKSYILTEMGIVKGKTEVNHDIVEKISNKISTGLKPVTEDVEQVSCCC